MHLLYPINRKADIDILKVLPVHPILSLHIGHEGCCLCYIDENRLKHKPRVKYNFCPRGNLVHYRGDL